MLIISSICYSNYRLSNGTSESIFTHIPQVYVNKILLVSKLFPPESQSTAVPLEQSKI
jgi:hypothetical protein